MFRCLIAKLLLCGCQSFIKENYYYYYYTVVDVGNGNDALPSCAAAEARPTLHSTLM